MNKPSDLDQDDEQILISDVPDAALEAAADIVTLRPMQTTYQGEPGCCAST